MKETAFDLFGVENPYKRIIFALEALEVHDIKYPTDLYRAAKKKEIPGIYVNDRWLFYKNQSDMERAIPPYDLAQTGTAEIKYTLKDACSLLGISKKTFYCWKEKRGFKQKEGKYIFNNRKGKVVQVIDRVPAPEKMQLRKIDGRKYKHKRYDNSNKGLHKLTCDIMAGEIGTIQVLVSHTNPYCYNERENIYKLAHAMGVKVTYPQDESRKSALNEDMVYKMLRSKPINICAVDYQYYKAENAILTRTRAGDFLEFFMDAQTNTFELPMKLRRDGSYDFTTLRTYKAGELLLRAYKGTCKGYPVATALDGNEGNLRLQNWTWTRKPRK